MWLWRVGRRTGPRGQRTHYYWRNSRNGNNNSHKGCPWRFYARITTYTTPACPRDATRDYFLPRYISHVSFFLPSKLPSLKNNAARYNIYAKETSRAAAAASDTLYVTPRTVRSCYCWYNNIGVRIYLCSRIIFLFFFFSPFSQFSRPLSCAKYAVVVAVVRSAHAFAYNAHIIRLLFHPTIVSTVCKIALLFRPVWRA